MPSGVKPQTWTIDPHLTVAPNLWRNVAFCAPVWESSGFPMDVVTGTFANTKNGGLWTQDETGGSFHVAADGDGILWPTTRNNLDLSDIGTDSDGFSIHLLVNLTDATPGDFDRVVEHSDASSTNPRWNIYHKAPNGDLELWNNTINRFVWAADWPGIGLHSIVITLLKTGTATNTAAANLWIDGVHKGEVLDEWTLAANPDARLGIADAADGIDNVAPGYYHLLTIWTHRVLTPADAKLLGRDPFVMLRPAGF